MTPEVPLFPRRLMEWTEKFYEPVFHSSGDFKLYDTGNGSVCTRDHSADGIDVNFLNLSMADYTFGDLKFGGNAQYISKDRWLHHTSFLWDYSPQRMECLLHPPKEPEYRKQREHSDFLCKLKDFMPDRNNFLDAVAEGLAQVGFQCEQVSLAEVEAEVCRLRKEGSPLQTTREIELP